MDRKKTVVISPEGGTFQIGKCKVIFPPGAVAVRSRFYFSLTSSRSMFRGGTILLTPILEWEPVIKFNAPVKVQLTTWTTTEARNVYVKILGQDTEYTDTKTITQVPLHTCNRVVEFDVFNSGIYWGISTSDIMSKLLYYVVPGVHYTANEGNICAHFRVDEEAVRLNTIRDIESNTFRPATILLNTLELRSGDRVTFSLKILEPEKYSIEPDISDWTVDEDYANILLRYFSFRMNDVPETGEVLKCVCTIGHKGKTESSDFTIHWPVKRSRYA